MADQKQITLYPGDATAKDIVLRELPVAAVATTEIFLYPGDAVAKDVVLRSVPGAAADGSAANITGAGGIASLEAFGQPQVGETVVPAAPVPVYGSGGIGFPLPKRPRQPPVQFYTPPWQIDGAGGIESGEAIGQPRISVSLAIASIRSKEQVGAARIRPGVIRNDEEFLMIA